MSKKPIIDEGGEEMNENQDLLDLCRLNQMEENVKESPAVDRDVTLKAIDWKKRQFAVKIKNNALKPSKSVMEKHKETQI